MSCGPLRVLCHDSGNVTQAPPIQTRNNPEGTAAMAGREAGFRHNKDTRKKIQAQQLINRLQAHVDADAPGLLDASQVNAAKALLNKVLPDLKAVEHTGEDGGPIKVAKVELVALDDG